MNELRASEGLAPLRLNPMIMKAAQVRATEEAWEGVFDANGGSEVVRNDGSVGAAAHTRPNGDVCFTVANANWTGENAVFEIVDMRSAVYNAYMGFSLSSGHRRNMLKPETTQMGFGMYKNTAGEWLCIQMFAAEGEVTWVDDPIMPEGGIWQPPTYDDLVAQWEASGKWCTLDEFIEFAMIGRDYDL